MCMHMHGHTHIHTIRSLSILGIQIIIRFIKAIQIIIAGFMSRILQEYFFLSSLILTHCGPFPHHCPSAAADTVCIIDNLYLSF